MRLTLSHLATRSSIHTASIPSRVRLAYEVYSPTGSDHDVKRSPLVFLHGFLGSRRENRNVSKILARDLQRSVYVVDLRNHGESGHHPKHDYTELAMDVEAFIDAHDLKDVTLVGHSMGAKTALTLALNVPELLSSIVAIDNAPIQLPLTEEFPRYLKGLEKVREAGIKTHAEGDSILKDIEDSPTIRLFLLSNFIRDKSSPYLKLRTPLDILSQAFGPLGDFPQNNRYAQFDKPTLVFRALQSHYIPESGLSTLARMFPHSKVVDVDCGHWIVQDCPEEFRRGVVEFLTQQ